MAVNHNNGYYCTTPDVAKIQDGWMLFPKIFRHIAAFINNVFLQCCLLYRAWATKRSLGGGKTGNTTSGDGNGNVGNVAPVMGVHIAVVRGAFFV